MSPLAAGAAGAGAAGAGAAPGAATTKTAMSPLADIQNGYAQVTHLLTRQGVWRCPDGCPDGPTRRADTAEILALARFSNVVLDGPVNSLFSMSVALDSTR